MAGQRDFATRMVRLMRLIRTRLNRRLLAWFLLFSLGPLLVTNAVGYQRSEAIIERLVENDLASITRTQAQHVRDRADHLTLLLQAIAAGNEFLAAGATRWQGGRGGEMGDVADRPAMERHLQSKLAEVPDFDALYLFTANGLIIAAAGDVHHVDALPPPTAGAAFVAERRETTTGIEPEFRLAVPILGSHGTPVAFLGGTLPAARARGFPQIAPHLAGHVETFIVDEHGRPLWVSHPHARIDYTLPLSTPLIGMTAEGHAHYRDRQGVPVLGMVTAVPGYPWRFVAEMPEAEAFGQLRDLRDLALALEVVFVVLLVATAWMVARDIVAPLRRLVDATRRVARGDLHVRVVTGERDELGELARAFNEMTGALAQTTARVRELHQREIERASQLATVGELASGIAHEIKNPVVGVASGLDLVRRRVGPDPMLTPILDEMTRQLARIQQTVQELLTYARPATPSFAPVSGSRVVERATRLVQPRAEQAGVRFVVRADPELPQLRADEEMLHQAVVNLLMNAIEATPAGGSISVDTRRAGGQFELQITDTGRGIAAANLEQVFKPFFTTRHTGTGLGLSITRDIVQRHGGSVSLDSAEGVGTTVIVRLPFHPSETGAPAAPHRSPREVEVA